MAVMTSSTRKIKSLNTNEDISRAVSRIKECKISIKNAAEGKGGHGSGLNVAVNDAIFLVILTS